MRRSAIVKEAFSDEDLERYREAMSQPGALTAALNYYRTAFRRRRRLRRFSQEQTVQAPTLVLWGEHDQALGKELTYGLERWVPNLTIHYLDCGHWTQQERPEEVNHHLMELLPDSDSEELGPPPAPLASSAANRPSKQRGRPSNAPRKTGRSQQRSRKEGASERVRRKATRDRK